MMTMLWAIANPGWCIAALGSMVLNVVLLLGWMKQTIRDERHLYRQQQALESLMKAADIQNRYITAQTAQLQLLKSILIQVSPQWSSQVGLIAQGIQEGWIRSTVIPFTRK